MNYKDMLEWRSIHLDEENPCSDCGGSGVKTYPTTDTWRGKVAGMKFTTDVCDKCWGSGVAERPWTNLRELHYAKHQSPTA